MVKASITGSIIGNLLLVWAFPFSAGGLRFKRQRFNKTAARSSCTALILAAAALVIPKRVSVAAAGPFARRLDARRRAKTFARDRVVLLASMSRC